MARQDCPGGGGIHRGAWLRISDPPDKIASMGGASGITYFHCSPWDVFRKADWNFSRYEDAIFARPCDTETVVYAAIDFCVSIVSLRDWTRKSLVRDVRKTRKKLPDGLHDLKDFEHFVAERVSWQKAVEAIANTSKHAEYRDSGWENGIARPASFFPENLKAEQDACEDGLELLALLHKHRDVAWWDIALQQHGDTGATTGYEAFGDVLDQWAEILKSLNYAED